MGIESDQLVLDYLSRVGDLAQQRGLTSAARMRLVSGLRAELEPQRAGSPAVVRRALARLGSPEAVVAAAVAEGAAGDGASSSREAREAREVREAHDFRDGAGAGKGTAVGGVAGGRAGSAGPAAPPGVNGSGPHATGANSLPDARAKLTGWVKRGGLDRLGGLTRKVLPAPRGEERPAVPDDAATKAPKNARENVPEEAPEDVASPPHLAGPDELGDPASDADWWRVEPGPFAVDDTPLSPFMADGPFGPYGPGETVPGFVGGIEIPEMRERPKGDGPPSLEKDGTRADRSEGATSIDGSPIDGSPADGSPADGSPFGKALFGKAPFGKTPLGKTTSGSPALDKAAAPEGTPPLGGTATGGSVESAPARPLWRRVTAWPRQRGAGAASGGDRATSGGAGATSGGQGAGAASGGEGAGSWMSAASASPVLLLATVLLVAGAVLGSWLPLVGGWALAYTSRRLSRTEAKFAALGVPALLVGGLLVWMWGRSDGRWGEPLAQARLGQALSEGFPVAIRIAAVASALFLVWRMRRVAR
ncbi:hypothetical protein [Streptomyces sp. NPDC003077]|uniref:hypothetical protein n=1 Tax=Streptomyces sp. NPDC003077 TaxID=3154443 RepID=UPI0033A25BC1